jgi:hypothetical protein
VRYPLIRKAVVAIPEAPTRIGGEVVCCSESGLAVFEKLHSQGHDDRAGTRA